MYADGDCVYNGVYCAPDDPRSCLLETVRVDLCMCVRARARVRATVCVFVRAWLCVCVLLVSPAAMYYPSHLCFIINFVLSYLFRICLLFIDIF